jgi:hypothetical protein
MESLADEGVAFQSLGHLVLTCMLMALLQAQEKQPLKETVCVMLESVVGHATVDVPQGVLLMAVCVMLVNTRCKLYFVSM